ncbi:hypothetical protein JVU11DRAFT_12082 [Chiua virens]|nr:hypothetical protein JVU11DRAFT_12082 [Chiua virens]
MGSTLFGHSTSQQQPATGGNIFGNTNTSQQQRTTGGGLFGNTTSSQQPSTTGGGLFGSTTTTTQPAPGTGGSIFGGTTQPTASGSIFGSTTPATTQAPAVGSMFGGTMQPTTGGSIFGGTPAQPAAGGGLFGGANTQQMQPQQTGTSLFSSTTTQPQQTGGGLFGATSTNTQHQSSTGTGGLFGATNGAAQPATGLFGAASTSAPASGGGLFGSSTASSNPLFGNKPPSSIFGTQPTGTGTSTNTIAPPTLFGQSTTQTTTAQPTPSIFGQTAQAQAQKPAGSLFGSTTHPPTTGTLFGSTLAAPSLGAGLGAGSILGTSTSRSSPSTPQQQDPQSQFVVLMQRIDAIAEAWNPNSPQCRFQVNINSSRELTLRLLRAARENPDSSCMVPVLAVGFDALNARVEAQSAQATAQQEKLKELKKRLQALTATHTDTYPVATASRPISTYPALAAAFEATVRSSSIRPEEEALRVALEEMEEDLRRPGGMSKLRSKLNELWALVGAINAARERGKKAGGEGAVEWTVVDEEGLKQITQILSDQQAGLQHLTKILQRDLKDLGVIMGTNGERDDGHMGAEMRFSASPSPLNSSTSTLHTSALGR